MPLPNLQTPDQFLAWLAGIDNDHVFAIDSGGNHPDVYPPPFCPIKQWLDSLGYTNAGVGFTRYTLDIRERGNYQKWPEPWPLDMQEAWDTIACTTRYTRPVDQQDWLTAAMVKASVMQLGYTLPTRGE